MAQRYHIRLYIFGQFAASTETHLRAALDACVSGRYDLEVVDVLKFPKMADEDQVIATPTVIRLKPPPVMRAIGNPADAVLLRTALSLD